MRPHHHLPPSYPSRPPLLPTSSSTEQTPLQKLSSLSSFPSSACRSCRVATGPLAQVSMLVHTFLPEACRGPASTGRAGQVLTTSAPHQLPVCSSCSTGNQVHRSAVKLPLKCHSTCALPPTSITQGPVYKHQLFSIQNLQAGECLSLTTHQEILPTQPKYP